MKTRIAATAAALAVLGGCAIQRAQDAEAARVGMVGMPTERVLACMGAPDSRAAAGATEVWTYHTGDGSTNSFGHVNQFGFYGGTSVTRSCKVDVVMGAGRVSRIQYSGLTGGILTEGEQCAYAVENCLTAAPRAP